MGVDDGRIVIPQSQDIPAELRPAQAVRAPQLKPKLKEIAPEDIPTPLNFQVLVLPVTVEAETEGGIVLSAGTVKQQNHFRSIGVVLAMGPLAYSTHRNYPQDYRPIQVGDWVHVDPDEGITSYMAGKVDPLVAVKFVPDHLILGKVNNPHAFTVLR